MLTKEELNKNRRDNRFSKQHNRYQSYKWQIISLFDRVRKEKMTHSALLEYRSEWIIGTEAYQTLPVWVKTKLDGVWDVCMDLLWRELAVCYSHPDTGALTHVDELLEAGLGSRLNTDTCHMCFTYDSVFYPFT